MPSCVALGPWWSLPRLASPTLPWASTPPLHKLSSTPPHTLSSLHLHMPVLLLPHTPGVPTPPPLPLPACNASSLPSLHWPYHPHCQSKPRASLSSLLSSPWKWSANSGGSGLGRCRHVVKRVKEAGGGSQKLVCSYRSPLWTQTMDCRLCIVLSDHMAASWWASWVWPIRGRYCPDHVQLRTLIQPLWSHCSFTAQLWTSAHYSGSGHTHTPPLSVTPCIRLYPVVTTPHCQSCCIMSSLCSVYISYLVVFSPNLVYFHQTWSSPVSSYFLSSLWAVYLSL